MASSVLALSMTAVAFICRAAKVWVVSFVLGVLDSEPADHIILRPDSLLDMQLDLRNSCTNSHTQAQ